MKNKKSDHEKLRIVWICHFMNQSMKEKLSIPLEIKEFAPWIPLGIEEFRKMNDIELHVIAPLYTILKNSKIDEGNIHYHFIKVGRPLSRKPWPNWFEFDLLSNFLTFNIWVKKLINKIKPDLINLIGAENAYYSSSVLGIKKYPILVTIQGFVSLSGEAEPGETGIVRKRIDFEREILTRMKYFGIEATSIEKYIRNLNPAAKMYWFHFPFAKTKVDIIPAKEYDIVFFARIIKMKGIEDAIKALAIAKKNKPDIKMEVIGKAEPTYMDTLIHLVSELDLTENIEFRGFIPTQMEMHYEVLKARISILPTYNDTIPGTIAESMMLGLPVISYRTGGIPDINKDQDNIILVEQGNIDGLSEEILKLLDNPKELAARGERAKLYATVEFDNTNSASLIVKAYRDIIKDSAR